MAGTPGGEVPPESTVPGEGGPEMLVPEGSGQQPARMSDQSPSTVAPLSSTVELSLPRSWAKASQSGSQSTSGSRSTGLLMTPRTDTSSLTSMLPHR